MQAIIKTKSNYRNLNGQTLKVIEIAGSRVTCEVIDEQTGQCIHADFGLKEV